MLIPRKTNFGCMFKRKILGFLTMVLGILQRSDLEPMPSKERILEVQTEENKYSNLSLCLQDFLLGNTFQGVVTIVFSTVFPCIFWRRNSQLFLTFCLSLTPVLLIYQGILLDMWIKIKHELDCCRNEVQSQNLSDITSVNDPHCNDVYSVRSCFDGYEKWINKWYISCFSLAAINVTVEVTIILSAIILLRQYETVKWLKCSTKSRRKRQDHPTSWIIQSDKPFSEELRSSLPKRESVRVIIATDRHIYSGLNVFTIDV
ncbi:hypothetical protein ACJMK2_026964 [Sinanodonta woodiana]|uniref:Uncharacterized protein n=1 Tax=Sinanodonta woodiana TaxID=1069815 RepID=A0ABD3XPU7_SINWO